MIKRILCNLWFLFMLAQVSAQEVKLVKGMKITKSTRVKKANYSLKADAGMDKYVILIEGRNIVVDFNDAVINGSTLSGKPNEFKGVCIVIRNSTNVTLLNARAKGFKIALRATNVKGLRIEKCDFSYNYRPQLNSTQEKEDISDWMSYHHNEKDEWLRYGAAIYLRDCDSASIENCKVTGGQNALMMTGCDDGRVMNNDFSFNSGIGIGMYRCNRNWVSFNRVIFNVRGYSHGIYNRGQDSAGILVYEQSNENKFYYNNVTHGGDGFFLWAGQTTMDSGKGGCNDNVLIGNDFSYAPTNGIEVTFSSNYIADNRIFECDHGIWGGYSYNTTIERNQFRDNRIGIAIEHGQKNKIENNLFSGDKTAIRLWSNKLEPSDWGYPKYRDTRSVAYHISKNSFNNHRYAINLSRSDSIWVHNNTFNGEDSNYLKSDSTVTHLDSLFDNFPSGSKLEPVVMTPHNNKAFEGSGKLRGRKNIMITEWGPYDFQYPLIWHINPAEKSDTLKFILYGPPGGNWKTTKYDGLRRLSDYQGRFPDTIYGLKYMDHLIDIRLQLEYRGPDFIDVFGNRVNGKTDLSHVFEFKKYFKPVEWEVLFFSMDTAFHNPIKTGTLFSPVERKAPIKTEKVNKLDYAWWGGIRAGENQYMQFMVSASAQAEFEPGDYELAITWDDAVRLWIDEKLVINEWNPSLYKFDESPHKKIRVKLGGKHSFRLEHLELGGFACLSLKIKKLY